MTSFLKLVVTIDRCVVIFSDNFLLNMLCKARSKTTFLYEFIQSFVLPACYIIDTFFFDYHNNILELMKKVELFVRLRTYDLVHDIMYVPLHELIL